jgi:hypothetical protein
MGIHPFENPFVRRGESKGRQARADVFVFVFLAGLNVEACDSRSAAGEANQPPVAGCAACARQRLSARAREARVRTDGVAPN